jgi:uncharacterized protein YhbP (UPF0306 family)
MENINSVQNLLKTHKVLTLATYDTSLKQPHVTNVFYYFEPTDNSIYFMSGLTLAHSQHLEENPQVGASVYDHESDSGGVISGAQIYGKCSVANIKEAIKAGVKFTKKFPELKVDMEMLKKVAGSRLFKIEINSLKYRDSNLFKGTVDIDLNQLSNKS